MFYSFEFVFRSFNLNSVGFVRWHSLVWFGMFWCVLVFSCVLWWFSGAVVPRGCGCPAWLWLSLVVLAVSRGCGSLVAVAGLSRLSLEVASCNSLVKLARGLSATLDHKSDRNSHREFNERHNNQSISGLVAEYIIAIDVTRVRFPADAKSWWPLGQG